MPHHIHSLDDYRFTKADKLFFDTNVWLFIHDNHRRQDVHGVAYRQAFARINEAQSQIYVDPIVLSEFANACLKDDFNAQQAQFTRPKIFRQSPAFSETADKIIYKMEKILARCHYLERGIKRQALEAFFPAYKTGQMDFNDHIIAQICAANGYTLFTADADFTPNGFDILTANPRLLKPRK